MVNHERNVVGHDDEGMQLEAFAVAGAEQGSDQEFRIRGALEDAHAFRADHRERIGLRLLSHDQGIPIWVAKAASLVVRFSISKAKASNIQNRHIEEYRPITSCLLRR